MATGKKLSGLTTIESLEDDDLIYVVRPSEWSGERSKGITKQDFVAGITGTGAVDSVNTQTGVVVLDADDIDDSATTNKFTTAADASKLAGIEANAKDDQTGAEIKALYEAEANTNAFTDALLSKINSITEIFTTALKSAYDTASSWVTTNGTNVVNHLSNTSNPHTVTKAQVGLTSVDDTSDADKPVSTAQQTALNLKQDSITLTTTGTSGASTLVSGTLNIPQYSGGGGSVDDNVYDGTWSGDLNGISKNRLYEKIETVIAGVGTGATPETFTAVGGETQWVVSTAITSSHKFFVNGLKLVEGTDYTQTASTFTFTGYTSVAGHEWEYFPDIAVPTTYNASDTSIADAGALITATDVEGALQENRTAIDLNTAKVTYVAPSTETGVALDLSNAVGKYYNMASANAGTTYTFSGGVVGGWAISLINTTSEPTVTGATKISGADWVTGTDMYLVVRNNGTATQFFFLAI